MFSSCDSDELTDQERAEITEEVIDRVNDYVDAFGKLDLERMEDFWANEVRG